MSKFIDLTNQRFGILTVIKKLDYKKHNHIIWECLCDCGNIITATGQSLKSKNTNSCGCRNINNKYAKNNDFETSSFNKLFRTYKNRSKKINKSFNLSENDVKILTSNNCFYCDSKPNQRIYLNVISKHKFFYIYNGIDRLDNSLGYEVDNCVSCCDTCNTMKMALGEQEFYTHIKRIHDHSIVTHNRLEQNEIHIPPQ